MGRPLRRRCAAAAVVVAACDGAAAAPQPAAPQPAAPARAARAGGWQGDTLRVAFGASAEVADGATLTFATRGVDGRCPVDTLCPAAGDATVIVRVAGARGAGEREVHTDRIYGPDTLTVGRTTLRLADLTPHRVADGPAAPDAASTALFVVAARRLPARRLPPRR